LNKRWNEGLIEGLLKPFRVVNELAFVETIGAYQLTQIFHLQAHGAAGLNFAFIDKSTHYHTQIDSLGTVSESSLQHHRFAGFGIDAPLRQSRPYRLPPMATQSISTFLAHSSLGIQYRAWWR